MAKPAIPSTSHLPPDIQRVLDPIKANVEIMTGARPGSAPLDLLTGTASLQDVITKVNQILVRINQNG